MQMFLNYTTNIEELRMDCVYLNKYSYFLNCF